MFSLDDIEAAEHEMLARAEADQEGQTWHHSSHVPFVNLFLLPFVVLFSGMTLQLIGALRYFKLHKSQIVLLFGNVLPLIAPAWERRWCSVRSLLWLLEHCTENCVFRLRVDGTDVEFDRPHSFWLARLLFGAKSKSLKHYAGRFLFFINAHKWIVHATTMATAFMSEVAMLDADGFLRELDAQCTEPLNLELILDRGYYFYKPPSDFQFLRVIKRLPAHLNAPETREERRQRKAKHEKRTKRTFYDSVEALRSKQIQRLRNAVEQANSVFKRPRLFKHRLPVKYLSKMRLLSKLSIGLANKHCHCPPAK
jgi:hypothetical protein